VNKFLSRTDQLLERGILLVVLFIMSGCESMCGSEPIDSQVSPNGELKAVAYLYDCGATTGFSTQVSIIDSDDEITSSGNTLVVDGKKDLKVKWLSDTELLISNTENLKAYKKRMYLRVLRSCTNEYG